MILILKKDYRIKRVNDLMLGSFDELYYKECLLISHIINYLYYGDSRNNSIAEWIKKDYPKAILEEYSPEKHIFMLSEGVGGALCDAYFLVGENFCGLYNRVTFI